MRFKTLDILKGYPGTYSFADKYTNFKPLHYFYELDIYFEVALTWPIESYFLYGLKHDF